MKYIVHGVSTHGWELEFETAAPTERAVWDQAVQVVSDEGVDFKMVEQSQRVLGVHPADHRCRFCPAESEPPPEQPDSE